MIALMTMLSMLMIALSPTRGIVVLLRLMLLTPVILSTIHRIIDRRMTILKFLMPGTPSRMTRPTSAYSIPMVSQLVLLAVLNLDSSR